MSLSMSFQQASSQHEHKNIGVAGLYNNGNTCFLNSVIQCLSNTEPLLEYIMKEEYKNDIRNISRSMLTERFADLIQSIWGENRGSLSSHPLKTAIVIYAPRFRGNNQQDAQELFRYLLAGLHEELNQGYQPRTSVTDQPKYEIKEISKSMSAEETWQNYLKTDNSKIVHIFGGLLRSVLKCTVCGFTSTVFEPFWDLSLPIPSNGSFPAHHLRSLYQCLDLFIKEEILEGSESPTCSKCRTKQICLKKILIEKFPQILVIHIKRFSVEGTANKVDTFVDFPVDGLDISKYTAEAPSRSILYNLYGVINHYGSCNYGHYTAFCKHPFSGQWHQFNDRIVAPITLDQTKRMGAYMLFYHIGK